MCIAFKLQSSASFRAITQIILAMNLYLETSFKAPSHSTVLLWMKKYGYHELCKAKEIGDDWVVILDESVQFGQNKLLVVYGIRQCDIDFSRPLIYRDLVTLALISKSSWNGDDIKEVLLDVEKRIGSIRYAVADQGNSIRKALKLLNIPHVYDLTHCISLIVEHIYKEDPQFQEYTKKMAHLRGTQALGKMAHVLPPLQRCKARFMNLRPISDWGTSVLTLLDSQLGNFSEEKASLAWVGAYRELIGELDVLNKIINEIQSLLKQNGLSKDNFQICKQILEQASTGRLIQFKNVITNHFEESINGLPQLDHILCSSDILESSFGKYKNYLQDNPMVGITNLCLSIAAFTGTMNEDEIKLAFETTKVVQIKEWALSNIGKTTLAKRMEVLKKKRVKKRGVKKKKP